jgi:hypothetical protein
MSDAADLASLFLQWSRAVDDYRDSNSGTWTPDQKLRLKDFSDNLDDISTHFTLADVAETIASLQGEVNQIKTLTAQAKETIKRLSTVDKVTKVVAAVVALGLSAESGNIGGVLGAIGDFTKATAAPSTGAGGATKV